MKRLDLAPGFAAALCLLRLLVEPGVFWSFLAAAAAHEAGHLTAAFALHVKVTGIRLDALDARIRMQASATGRRQSARWQDRRQACCFVLP